MSRPWENDDHYSDGYEDHMFVSAYEQWLRDRDGRSRLIAELALESLIASSEDRDEKRAACEALAALSDTTPSKVLHEQGRNAIRHKINDLLKGYDE